MQLLVLEGRTDSNQVVRHIDRERAIVRDHDSTDSVDLGWVWDDLVHGNHLIADSFHAGERCYLLLVQNPRVRSPREKNENDQRSLQILEAYLLDGCQKSLGYDFGLCAASISASMKRCLLSMGLDCCPSRVPPLLSMAAAARRAQPNEREAPATPCPRTRRGPLIVSVTRPDGELSVPLTPAQRAVLRLLLDGETHERMALLRGGARRTIANHLATVFQILQMSGRAELIARLSRAHVERLGYRARVSSYDAPAVATAREQAPLSATG